MQMPIIMLGISVVVPTPAQACKQKLQQGTARWLLAVLAARCDTTRLNRLLLENESRITRAVRNPLCAQLTLQSASLQTWSNPSMIPSSGLHDQR